MVDTTNPRTKRTCACVETRGKIVLPDSGKLLDGRHKFHCFRSHFAPSRPRPSFKPDATEGATAVPYQELPRRNGKSLRERTLTSRFHDEEGVISAYDQHGERRHPQTSTVENTGRARLFTRSPRRRCSVSPIGGAVCDRPHVACVGPQNSPTMLPSSSTSMFSAAGTFGRPGIVMMAPVLATTKPAPAETPSSRTVIRKPSGAPSASAW